MLGGLPIKAADSWLGCKRSTAVTYAKRSTIQERWIFFHNRLKVLLHTVAILAEATFNDLQALETKETVMIKI